ncbi:FAD-dependent oxidoreductase [Peribacillus cavernae]|uniref:FAD-dependent oxidoreductase n=1 Tax=Peribacillus cavernae TaxID=1674310 RepID=A0A3S1BAB2_9BACI|nr:FAD-dependent oxidoreductase [Peribacillus cavernae]MDQ0218619.1 glycine/D-amino acid oxidase-like deaminating enzyme/nitrite reductase/ring-hydroxylating ferredoxin subunit [Peribacillus cavernae]RUQ31603.1 FAD-dependent oxidoreductase [Peribacillus cavernae]
MADQNEKKQLPQYPEPYWRDFVTFPPFSKLDHDIETDVAIVGGGITGITAAYLLSKEGINVVLIDAGEILNGTTGHTTAKITAQHGLIYDQLIKDIGEEKAKLYFEANNEAKDFVIQTVSELQIDCDLTYEDAYVYAETKEYVSKIQDELKAYQKLGIPGEYAETIPFPIPCKAAVIMKEQAQFHPLKYLTALLPHITKAGVKLFEHTTAMKIEDGDSPKILTRDGHTISCNYVISASHFPFNDEMGLYFARMHADRSYVLGIKAEKEYPGGMYISADSPTRSLRYTDMDGEKLILVGGESHKTGQGISMFEHYEALKAFSDQVFDVKEIPYRWSAQDIITMDKVPYIGPMTENHPSIFVATGYAKWGMTNGTAAALLLKDLILKKENRFLDLYTPSRFHAKPGVKNVMKDNADVAKHLIQGKFAMVYQTPDDLGNDEAAIVKINGDKAGCYRDKDGQLHIIDSTCTHMGCEVEWNSGERTWDCPCHASRYTIDGEIIEGPAVEPLKKVDLE